MACSISPALIVHSGKEQTMMLYEEGIAFQTLFEGYRTAAQSPI
jgi:hypothetical protein